MMTHQLATVLDHAQQWTTAAAPYVAALATLALALAAGRALRRTRRARHALTHRVTYELVPTSTFDPSEATVGRWARHLGRPRYAVAATPQRGAAVRIRYTARDGRLRCYLEGPAEAAAILAMPGFPEVEVRSAVKDQAIKPVRFTPPTARTKRPQETR